MSIDPDRLPPNSIPAAELARVESLGINCELGFVLQALGNNTPSIFRWAWTPPEAIIKLLESDFVRLYDFRALIPVGPKAVLDMNYDIKFHSNVETKFHNGVWQFSDPDEAGRRRLLETEQNLILGLTKRFQTRIRTPDVLYVMANNNIAAAPPELVDAIAMAITVRSDNTRFAFLEVVETSDPAMFGRISQTGEFVYRGYLSRFAPIWATDDVDLDNWVQLLKSALAATRELTMNQMNKTGRRF